MPAGSPLRIVAVAPDLNVTDVAVFTTSVAPPLTVTLLKSTSSIASLQITLIVAPSSSAPATSSLLNVTSYFVALSVITTLPSTRLADVTLPSSSIVNVTAVVTS